MQHGGPEKHGPDPAPARGAGAPPGRDGPQTPVGQRADFSAKLESFQGPLDLLLYLIKENEVDIAEIPIAQILVQYVQYLEAASDWDLHVAGEFLVMATTLMEIKSRELLPPREALEEQDLIEDPRSELVRQLLRYRRLKDQAQALQVRRGLWARRCPRGWYDEIPEAPPESAPREELAPSFDLYELLTVFERMQRAVLASAPRRVSAEGETVEECIARIEGILKERPFARFAELLPGERSRENIAATFVALLELVRRRMIRLLQGEEFGPLDVRVQSEKEAEELARREAAAAGDVADAATRERAAREARLAEEAAAMGVDVDKLPWRKRRAILAKQRFSGVVRPEDLEEIDAEDAEIGRRMDAIFAAVDAISQRFEESRAQARTSGKSSEAALADAPPSSAVPVPPDASAPVTEAELAPQPEAPPAEASEGEAAPSGTPDTGPTEETVKTSETENSTNEAAAREEPPGEEAAEREAPG